MTPPRKLPPNYGDRYALLQRAFAGLHVASCRFESLLLIQSGACGLFGRGGEQGWSLPCHAITAPYGMPAWATKANASTRDCPGMQEEDVMFSKELSAQYVACIAKSLVSAWGARCTRRIAAWSRRMRALMAGLRVVCDQGNQNSGLLSELRNCEALASIY